MIKFIIGYLYSQLQVTIHKFWVCYYLIKITQKICPQRISTREKYQLWWRAIVHDLSKYSWAEAKGFATTIFKLKHTPYGSKEYKNLLKKIRPCINHHYSKNRHHPQYHKNEFQDMNKLDKIEMIVDWRAATRRHVTGCICKSIEMNQERFKYSDEDKQEFLEIIQYIK